MALGFLSICFCFSTYEVSVLGFLDWYDFNPDLKVRWNAECSVILLKPLTSFQVDAVIGIDGWSRFWFGYLRTHFKHSIPAPPLKNIWNGLGANWLFFLANLQFNAYFIIKLNRCCWPSFNIFGYFVELFIRK